MKLFPHTQEARQVVPGVLMSSQNKTRSLVVAVSVISSAIGVVTVLFAFLNLFWQSEQAPKIYAKSETDSDLDDDGIGDDTAVIVRLANLGAGYERSIGLNARYAPRMSRPQDLAAADIPGITARPDMLKLNDHLYYVFDLPATVSKVPEQFVDGSCESLRYARCWTYLENAPPQQVEQKLERTDDGEEYIVTVLNVEL